MEKKKVANLRYFYQIGDDSDLRAKYCEICSGILIAWKYDYVEVTKTYSCLSCFVNNLLKLEMSKIVLEMLPKSY